MTTDGIIEGNGHRLELSPGVTTLGGSAGELELRNTHLHAHDDLTISDSLRFNGTCVFDGGGNQLTLGTDGKIIVDSNSSLTMKNVLVNKVKGTKISCVDDTGTIVLDNVIWVLKGDTQFHKGALDFCNSVDFVGDYKFTMDSAMTSTVESNAIWSLRKGVVLEAGKNAQSGAQPLSFACHLSSRMLFDDSTLRATATGLELVGGIIEFARDVTLDVVGSVTEDGLIFGDGVSNGPTFDLFPGTKVYMKGGPITFDLSDPDGIRSQSVSTRLKRCNSGSVNIKSDLNLTDITLDVWAGKTLTFEGSAAMNCTNCCVMEPLGNFVFTGCWDQQGMYKLAGEDSLMLNSGQRSDDFTISGTGNTLYGTGNINSTVCLADANSDVAVSLDGLVAKDFPLNGGTLILDHDLHFCEDHVPSGSGTINLGGHGLYLGARSSSLSSALTFDGSGGSLNLQENLLLSNDLTFSGDCILHGHGREIDLTPGGGLVVEDGSTLRLSGLTLKGVGSGNIRCKDDVGKLILEDVVWHQDSDLTFSYGALEVVGGVRMMGDGKTFALQTSVTSTINAESRLILDMNFTFSYDPQVADDSLLVLADDTSKIVLKNAELHTTVTGLALTKGILLAEGDAVLSSDSVEGGAPGCFTFGDGVTASEDITACVRIGSGLLLRTAVLAYKNLGTASWMMENNSSRLAIEKQSVLRLHQPLNLANGSVVLHQSSALETASGAQINGDVHVKGMIIQTAI